MKASQTQAVSKCQSIPMRRGAFSLVELLVVMAVISILLALLMPALTSARENARMVACANNIRQIHQLVLLYAGDNNGRLPPAIEQRPSGYALTLGRAVSKMLALGNPDTPSDPDYRPITSISIMMCPKRPLARLEQTAAQGAGGSTEYGGYVCNQAVLGVPANNYPIRRLAEFTRPAKVWAFSDGGGFAGLPYTADGTFFYRFAFDHGGKVLVAWVDGHVTPLTYQELLDNKNDIWGVNSQ